ncbi:polysaccharide deacetylase family protein [Flavihumibacter sp. CACIAM 22H1]|uniref:polysaccharide deacetylase family protein n=1 Tax=Flavihumibacter sp. CACIAM 22H1 TaxID=1812911 RepID=UPI0007A822B2|nr:polysaccharide deacetylase family protein [Flavihumibacter sp. CACIAM 22H1]KYP13722.1 MAG: hypothetical protein A1D16_04430 [Flavihumibacter sp. CACIAM 22H1]
MRKFVWAVFLLVTVHSKAQLSHPTYAEQLGFPKGARVVILHVDDAGMSYDANIGAMRALTEGVASSVSIMMPCPWVPQFINWLKENPRIDAGLHLTLNAEWQLYKWGPLSGAPAVPGLVDTSTGAMYASVEQVVKNAQPEEVGKEISAQINRARQMGWEPTHLDTHMGTVFADPRFTMQYIQIGIREKIPVMLPGGHNTVLFADDPALAQRKAETTQLGQLLWKAGLPVLDDLHNKSYGWIIPAEALQSDKALQAYATRQYIQALEECRPGLTMLIMHCTQPSELFKHISDSGPRRKADLLGMLSPAVKKYIREKGIILTTWRELMERRKKLSQ